MRRGRQGGFCAKCGAESDDGLYWESYAKVIDFGVPSMAPIEPDMTTPVLCDDCELDRREEEEKWQ